MNLLEGPEIGDRPPVGRRLLPTGRSLPEPLLLQVGREEYQFHWELLVQIRADQKRQWVGSQLAELAPGVGVVGGRKGGGACHGASGLQDGMRQR